MKEEEKTEELLKKIRNLEDKNDERLKAIEDEKEIQTKIISKNIIKPPLLKSIYSQEVKYGRINNNNSKKIFKTIEGMERSEIYHSKLLYKLGDNKYYSFDKFGWLSSCNAAKLNMNEFQHDTERLKNKKTRNDSYEKKFKNVLKNTEALYKGLEIIANAFEKQVFDYDFGWQRITNV